jgi:hypothetical protein
MKRFEISTCTVALGTAIALVGIAVGPSVAQVPWDSPQLMAPGAPPGISLLYVDFGLRPHDGTGMVAAYRTKPAPAGFGVRLAATTPGSDRMRVSGGVDVAVSMITHSQDFPLDVIWTSGVGASYGDYYAVGLPVGFAAGRSLSGDHIWFNPYLSTRIIFESYFGSGRPADQFNMALAADVGADIAFDRNRTVILRAAASLGDRRAIVAGLHTAFGR